MTDAMNARPRPSLVLVVDDEPGVRESTVAALELSGYRAVEASCAAEALYVLESREDVDVLVTDIRMAGDINGAELAFAVHTRWPSIGLVILSGYVDPKARLLPGGASFVAKPYRIPELIAAIQQQLARS